MEKKHITARIDKSLADKIEAMAKKDDRSFSVMVGRLLAQAVKGENNG
ncbi:MAG: ribbon-helix-helix protein, CopG family [Aeromonas veronii]